MHIPPANRQPMATTGAFTVLCNGWAVACISGARVTVTDARAVEASLAASTVILFLPIFNGTLRRNDVPSVSIVATGEPLFVTVSVAGSLVVPTSAIDVASDTSSLVAGCVIITVNGAWGAAVVVVEIPEALLAAGSVGLDTGAGEAAVTVTANGVASLVPHELEARTMPLCEPVARVSCIRKAPSLSLVAVAACWPSARIVTVLRGVVTPATMNDDAVVVTALDDMLSIGVAGKSQMCV